MTIPDKLFKRLLHQCDGYEIHLSGNSLEPGYKPDFVLKKEEDYLILESENASSRKTFVGGMIKAAHFLQGNRTGKLIFVIVAKKNTSARAIANHLKKNTLRGSGIKPIFRKCMLLRQIIIIKTINY